MFKKRKTVLAYNPYLYNFGGGEKYFMDVLNVLVGSGLHVTLYNSTDFTRKEIDAKFIQRFGYCMDPQVRLVSRRFRVRILDYLFLSFYSFIYNTFITVTNEFPHISLSKNRYCILQFPYIKNDWLSLIRKKIQYSFVSKIIVYSKYVQSVVKKYYKIPKEIYVIYPFIEDEAVVSKKTVREVKKNKILCVGRFIENENSKGQELAISIFKELVNNYKLKMWELVLLGGVIDENSKFIEKLKLMSKGYNVKFLLNASSEEKKNQYAESKFYWHLAGYKKDLSNNPGEAEHFGITVIEAMRYGTLPFCFTAGGPVEILNFPDLDFLLWKDEKELIQKTINLIKSPNLSDILIKRCLEHSMEFNHNNFKNSIFSLFNS